MTTTMVKQCKSCPWKVDCDPDRDIPGGYCRELHAKLKDTVREGVESLVGCRRWMACHHSPVGAETVCAGWLHHQIGPGNNIAARLAVMTGRFPVPVVDGDQHERFEDTLPEGA